MDSLCESRTVETCCSVYVEVGRGMGGKFVFCLFAELLASLAGQPVATIGTCNGKCELTIMNPTIMHESGGVFQ